MSERIYPDDMNPANEMSLGHKFRYMLARGFLDAGYKVLDAACGCGYGSYILAQLPGVEVHGLDYDQGAIDYAEAHYLRSVSSHGSASTFEVADLDAWEPGSVDAVVSFETIEHLVQEPKVFADKLKKAASKLIIVSAPIVPTVGVNHYHKHDLTDEQMVGLFQDENWMLYEKIKQRVYGVYVFVKRDRIEGLR